MMNTAPTRFVILAVPRTGSNLLCTLLNSHPEILCHHEVFNPQGIFTALTHREVDLGLGTVAERDCDPIGFIDKVWLSGRSYGCVGFKWTRRQNEDVLGALSGDPTVKKIVLYRRNRVKTYVSDKIAQQTQQWEVYRRRDLQWPRPTIEADRDELEAHAELNTRFYSRLTADLRSLQQPYTEATYERLFEPGEQQRLLEFLGVSDTGCQLAASSVKQNPTDLRNLVANHDDFFASVSGGPFESELLDVEA